MTLPFISEDDLANFTGDDSLDADRAVIALDAACESIRTFLNRPLNLASVTQRLDGSGTDTLVLRERIVSVEAVTLYPGEDIEEELDETEWLFDGSLLFRAAGTWPRGRRNIAVEYTYGFAVDEDDVDDSGDVQVDRLPADIREVALELAKRIYESGSGSSAAGSLVSRSIGPDSYSETFDPGAEAVGGGGMSADQRERLEPYRYASV